MRIKRKTLRSEKRGNRVFVLLGPEQTTEHASNRTPDHTEELIATLREQLAAERQAHAEARRIIAGLVERIPPQIEAPSEPRESPESPGPSETPAERSAGPQRPSERPWWRRVFGG